MHTGQMLQTIGALGLLSLLILNANRSILNNTQTVYTGQYATTAISIAQSYLLEATSKEFDEKVIGQSLISDPSKFTSTLGPESGESARGKFDDLDDYNRYTELVSTPTDTLTTYVVECSVDYVAENDFSSVSKSPTFYKRIIVSVFIPYGDPEVVGDGSGAPRVSLSSIISYH